MKLSLSLAVNGLSIVKLTHGSMTSFSSSGFFYFFRSTDETTLICPGQDAPADAVDVSAGWVGFKVEGPLDFSLVGIMAELSRLLAEDGISLVALSTYDTDWILVKADQAENAAKSWRRGGHDVTMDSFQPIEPPRASR